MLWYRAFFCKEQDYTSYPLNERHFDIITDSGDGRDDEIARIERAGWGANTHWQHIGYITPGDAMMKERAGEIVKVKTCSGCRHHSITGSNDPCLNPESPQHGIGTDFQRACPFYDKAGPWVTLTNWGD